MKKFRVTFEIEGTQCVEDMKIDSDVLKEDVKYFFDKEGGCVDGRESDCTVSNIKVEELE